MSDRAKETLELLRKAIEEGRISDFDLGYIAALAVVAAGGEKCRA